MQREEFDAIVTARKRGRAPDSGTVESAFIVINDESKLVDVHYSERRKVSKFIDRVMATRAKYVTIKESGETIDAFVTAFLGPNSTASAKTVAAVKDVLNGESETNAAKAHGVNSACVYSTTPRVKALMADYRKWTDIVVEW